MSRQPTSLEQAKIHRYGKWAGCPNGNPYQERYCAAHIMMGGRGSLPTQCRSKPGHGPDGIYCKTHALEHFPESLGTWYKSRFGYTNTIEPVQVANFSGSTVTVITGHTSHRTKRSGSDYSYFPTFDEAKDWLIGKIEGRLKRAESDVVEYRKTLENVKSLEP